MSIVSEVDDSLDRLKIGMLYFSLNFLQRKWVVFSIRRAH